MKDPLDDLLARADAAMPAPHASTDIAKVVRRRARRTTNLRIAAAVLLAVGVVSMVLRATHRNQILAHQGENKNSPASIAILQTELRELDSEARIHEKTAAALARQLALAKRADALLVDPPDPLERVHEARSRAASIVLRDAERLESLNRPEAQNLYQNTVRLFPETQAARAAQERLNSGGVIKT
ncbi:MAG TPA: hypothetical protein VN541_00470 [Tepidisphaeraceae bacterium]|nr:hypothetical protein [Tepidisphaeraceae bacterium]